MTESITQPCILHLSREIFFGNLDRFICKTLYLFTLEWDLMSHPRIRGEYRHAESVVASLDGSPPHTRGIRFPGVCQSV